MNDVELKRSVKRGYRRCKMLADEIGMSESNLCRILNKKTHPNVVAAIRIARKLGVTVEDIWGEDVDGSL